MNREELFGFVFNQHFQFMAILDTNGIVVEINDLPLKVQSVDRSDYLGKYFWESPAWQGNKEMQAKIRAQVLSALDSEGAQVYKDQFLTADGELRYAEAAYMGIRNSASEIIGIMVQASDTTAQQQAELRLRESEFQFRSLFEQSPMGIAYFDDSGKVLNYNHSYARIHGISSKSEWPYGLFDNPSMSENVRSRIKKGETVQFQQQIDFNALRETAVFNSNHYGTIYTELIVSQLHEPDKNQPVGYMAQIRDISARKKAEFELKRNREQLEELVMERTEQLQRSNQDLEQFAAIASHDLQEPLRKIASFSQLLMRSENDRLSEQGKDYLEYLDSSVQRMNMLIKDLLTYSRIDSDDSAFTMVNLNSVMEHILADLRLLIEENKAAISCDTLRPVRANESQMYQLFANLIKNSLKYRKKETPARISIGMEEQNAELVLEFTDNGIGFDQQYAKQIFEPFKRLHGIGEYSGNGIGLALCERIVRRHGGRVSAKSEPGKGATFTVCLPIG